MDQDPRGRPRQTRSLARLRSRWRLDVDTYNSMQNLIIKRLLINHVPLLYIDTPPGTGRTYVLSELARLVTTTLNTHTLILSAVTDYQLDRIIKTLESKDVSEHLTVHVQSTHALNKSEFESKFSIPSHVSRLLQREQEDPGSIETDDLVTLQDYDYLANVNQSLLVLDMKVVKLVFKYNKALNVIITSIEILEKHPFLRNCSLWYIDEASIILTSQLLALKSQTMTSQIVIVGDQLQLAPPHEHSRRSPSTTIRFSFYS